jgi:hypothetical protein
MEQNYYRRVVVRNIKYINRKHKIRNKKRRKNGNKQKNRNEQTYNNKSR